MFDVSEMLHHFLPENMLQLRLVELFTLLFPTHLIITIAEVALEFVNAQLLVLYQLPA